MGFFFYSLAPKVVANEYFSASTFQKILQRVLEKRVLFDQIPKSEYILGFKRLLFERKNDLASKKPIFWKAKSE